MRYHFKIHKEGKGFWAQCVEIPTCVTQGDSEEELFENMQDAINTYLDEPESSDFLAPMPQKKINASRSIVEVAVDPAVAFGFTIRQNRLKKGLTQKEAAKKLGMKNLFSYQRLEKRCNPTLEMIVHLIDLFPNISLDKVFK